MRSIRNKGDIHYLGIAADEAIRIQKNSKPGIKMPLVECNWDEAYCRQWCEENDLLSPIYTTATRGGCWFCHNQSVNQLRLLRKNYPDLWALMLKWDVDSPGTFHADGHTVRDFERRFEMEDENLVPKDRCFRWKMLEENKMQRALLRSNIIKRLLKKSKKDLKSYSIKYKINRVEDCIIEVNQRNKKYCCFFNECYILFTYAGKNYKPVENKELEKQLKNILNGGCSKSKYIHEVNLEKLKECAAKYKIDRKTLYSFRFNFGSEEMFLNPIFLSDCLKFASTNVIYFNTKWSPVVFKNSGEELRRFGILFPVKKNS